MRIALLVALAVLAAVAAGCGGAPRRTSRTEPAPHRVAPAGRRGRRRAAPPSPAEPRDQPVPILEYHVVQTPTAGTPNPQLYVDPAAFLSQLRWLARRGWHAVTLDAVLAHWRSDRPLPREPVVLTFDDGYPSDWSTALPDLRARGWPGTLNLQVGNLVPRRVRQLLAGGWEVDAHTFTHPDLTQVDAARLRREVGGSRAWIRDVFGVPVDSFAYPAGREDARVRSEVGHAGFLAAETEDPGWASPGEGMLQLDRLEVLHDTTLAEFAHELDRSWT